MSLYAFTWRLWFIRSHHSPFRFYPSSDLESCSFGHTLTKTCPNTTPCSSLAELPPAPMFAFPHLHVCRGLVLRVPVQLRCELMGPALVLLPALPSHWPSVHPWAVPGPPSNPGGRLGISSLTLWSHLWTGFWDAEGDPWIPHFMAQKPRKL